MNTQSEPRYPAETYGVKSRHFDRLSLPHEDDEVFQVQGAGWLAVGSHPGCRCGTASGITVDPSWGEFGYSGGVLDMTEVVRLRDHLTAVIELNRKEQP